MDAHTDDFLPGQRWLSETQTELGLGTVVASDARHVQIAYPATGESRLYARSGAPLVRVRFGPGDRIRDRAGREVTIHTVEETDGLLVYQGEDLAGQPCRVVESDLDDHLRLNRPREKLLAGRVDRDTWFSLRLATWERTATLAKSPVRGLIGSRVSLVPHQLYIAAEVASRYAPRVLLADEVGLGKTIEAGLILHRLVLSGRVGRVLVVVPEPLLHQWLVEMLRRFNLRFALFDEARCTTAEANPFHAEQLVLCSLELLLRREATAQAAGAGDWDLLIVDEAHRLTWSEQAASPAYATIEGLARDTPAVLLLTATPEQLGRAGHFGRLRLLDPQRFSVYARFLAEERAYEPVATLAARLLEGETPDAADRQRLQQLLGESAATASADRLIEQLIDRHGTGRILFRNTRAAVPGFPGRALQPHPLPRPSAYAVAARDAEAGLYPELACDAQWTDVDPRVPWLAETLRALRPGKVLVICAHATTVVALREALLHREGIHAAMFHEGMEIVERDRAAAYFAEREAGTEVLLCSEIGSEGRNFQFAHQLILFDLPLDPDLLEQRIGRLDRIGQTRTVQVHVPYLQGSAGEVAFRWHAQALDTFTAPCPAGSALYRAFREDLRATMRAPEGCARLIRVVARERERLNAELEAGRDRLLELHSNRPAISGALVDAVQEIDADRGLYDYMTRFWDLYGVEHEPGPGSSVVLRPGGHMLQEGFPQLPAEGATTTFDRSSALAHEDREFLTWEHPMVRGAMDLLTGSDLGSAAITALRDARFRRGSLLLEMIYVAECPAPPELQVGRFLPPTALRLLLAADGNECAALYPHESLRGTCLTRNRKLAAAVIGSQAERLRRLLEQGERLAQERVAELIAEARQEMERLLTGELERLRQLATVTAGVRPAEVDHLEEQRRGLARQLAKARLRLDALRVLVTH